MKLIHSLRFQFITLFSVFIIALIGITSILEIGQLAKEVAGTFSLQGIHIVEKAASIVDGDSFEALAKSLDGDDPFYEETRIRLLEIKELAGCLFLYTMAPVNGDIWQFVIDGSAEPDDEDNFSALGDEEDTTEYDDAFKRVLVSGETEFADLVYQEGWGWLITIYTPIKNSAGKIVGIAACDFDGTFLHNSLNENIRRQIVIGGISVFLGLVLLVFFLRKIFTPLGSINAILKEISLGEGDLTRTIVINSKSEIGDLSHYFNRTLEKIKNLIVIIKEQSLTLSDTGNELAGNMAETAAAINEITENIQAIKSRVLSQSAGVTQTHATMEQVVTHINRLDGLVEKQSTNVSSVSTAIEEMAASIQSVTATLSDNAANVLTLRGASEAGRGGLQEVAADIQEIARESEGLLEINSVMENIASQTSLLSMNAAIEAAHAGEAGKGFAVVAGEIRKLAENSSKQSKTIIEVLKKIKGSIDKITGSTENVLARFEAIDSSVKIVSEQEAHIRGAMEEQGTGSRQIVDSVTGVNELTRQVKSGCDDMLEGSKEVIQESENLGTVTQEITQSMNEMASGAEQMNVAVLHVNEISDRNRKNIALLLEEVSRFKV
ncbi:MAG: methyl-accepting chemotaxis protein [Treponema sp.]|nr:methyl-accepting chemotaxis protein [Treponema sp.]